MKLSEAILLGSAVVSSRAGGLRFALTNQGCALGMAAIAAGCTFRQSASANSGEGSASFPRFPHPT
jgi:hypothetical protein